MGWKKWKMETVDARVFIDPGERGHTYLRPKECEALGLYLIQLAFVARMWREKQGGGKA